MAGSPRSGRKSKNEQHTRSADFYVSRPVRTNQIRKKGDDFKKRREFMSSGSVSIAIDSFPLPKPAHYAGSPMPELWAFPIRSGFSPAAPSTAYSSCFQPRRSISRSRISLSHSPLPARDLRVEFTASDTVIRDLTARLTKTRFDSE